WLLSIINDTLISTGASKYGVIATPFFHPWDQFIIAVNIPGKAESFVVLGAHPVSVNHADPVGGRVPAADDDGSRTMTLETLRVLLFSKNVLEGKAEHRIQSHSYSGEKGGLLVSQAIFQAYEKGVRMLRLCCRRIVAGREPQFGLMMHFVHEPLMDFAKLVIDEAWAKTGCGCFCGSYHTSANRTGYPTIFIIEAEFNLTSTHLHGDNLTNYLDYYHMIYHAEYILALTFERKFAELKNAVMRKHGLGR
ncbi:putative aminopeptidase, partial [Calycina marina]